MYAHWVSGTVSLGLLCFIATQEINESGKCNLLLGCVRCICDGVEQGNPCPITQSMYEVCVGGPVPLSRGSLSECQADVMCAQDCVSNLLQSRLSARCMGSTLLSQVSCGDLARVYHAERSQMDCNSQEAYLAASNVPQCCGSGAAFLVPSSTVAPSPTPRITRGPSCRSTARCYNCICQSTPNCGITRAMHRVCSRGGLTVQQNYAACMREMRCKRNCIGNILEEKLELCHRNNLAPPSCAKMARILAAGGLRRCPRVNEYLDVKEAVNMCCATLT